MAIGVYFPVQGMTPDIYAEVLTALEEAEADAPAGRSYHCAFEHGDGLHVFDVWDSEETFADFGEILIPILAGLGLDPPQPDVSPIHNIVVGT